jgi:hypothetical protein
MSIVKVTGSGVALAQPARNTTLIKTKTSHRILPIIKTLPYGMARDRERAADLITFSIIII